MALCSCKSITKNKFWRKLKLKLKFFEIISFISPFKFQGAKASCGYTYWGLSSDLLNTTLFSEKQASKMHFNIATYSKTSTECQYIK